MIGWLGGAGVVFIIGIYTFALKKAPRITTFCWLVGGLVIGGLLAVWTGRALATAVVAAGGATQRLVGFSIATIFVGIALVMAYEVIVRGMWPKPIRGVKAEPKRFHPPLALVFPTVGMVSGAAPVIWLLDQFRTLVGV